MGGVDDAYAVQQKVLAATSGAQLATGILGMAVALKRNHPYDFLLLHGRPETVARDSILMGTALSAPVYMLVAQGVATGRLARGATAPITSKQNAEHVWEPKFLAEIMAGRDPHVAPNVLKPAVGLSVAGSSVFFSGT